MIKQNYTTLILGALFAVLLPSMAFAQETVNTVAENITESAGQLPGLVAALTYLSGILIAATAVTKTIEHVGNPAQVPLKIPASRFLVGGALFALPIIIEAAYQTINGGAGNTFNAPTEAVNSINGFLSTFSGALSLGTDINGVLYNIEMTTNQIPGLISALSYLLGVLLSVTALYHVRDHVEDPNRVALKLPVIRFVTAGALFAMPTIYNAMYTAVADSGLGGTGTFFSFLTGAYFLYSTESQGAECATAFIGFSGTGLGDVICNAMTSSIGLPSFLTAVAYVLGLIFGVWGVLKVRDHVVDPSRTMLNEGITRLLAGGAFFALPFIVVVMRETFMPTPLNAFAGVATNYGFNDPGVSGGFFGLGGCGSASGTNGLDVAMSCFMQDILGPSHVALNFFCFVAGMIFIMIGISRLIKSTQEGPKGPGGLGTVTTFAIGGLLISATTILRAISSSMFGDTVTTTVASLTYTTGLSTAESDAVYNVIAAVLKFMIVIGMISFVRGLFIIRDVSEGKQQASVMAGMTHIIGGALAVNLGPLMNAVQSTLNITAFGVSFGT